jgi:DNA-binding MarR family transcriptional regulator
VSNLYRVQLDRTRCTIMAMSSKRTNVSAKPKGSLLLGEQLCFALYSTSLAMTKIYRKLLRELRLTYPQYLVMLVLWERDGVSVSEIGERLYLNSATLTPLLKRIEALGLISRRRAHEDERHVIVSLSRAGRELRQKTGEVQHGVFHASGCTLDELVAIRQQLDQLRSRLMENA